MKQDVFEILLYLFENYIYDEELEQDRDTLQEELQAAGFKRSEIGKAFDWLEGLSGMQERGFTIGQGEEAAEPAAMRIYSERELERLDCDCRGFLLFLEQMKVLDQMTREMVIDRVMALDSDEIDLDQLKWVVLMVLFNQPDNDEAVAWMEDLVMDESSLQLH